MTKIYDFGHKYRGLFRLHQAAHLAAPYLSEVTQV